MPRPSSSLGLRASAAMGRTSNRRVATSTQRAAVLLLAALPLLLVLAQCGKANAAAALRVNTSGSQPHDSNALAAGSVPRRRSLTQSCQWTCDVCSYCQPIAPGRCQMFGAPEARCHMISDCVFGPILYRANQTLTPPTQWPCTPPGQASGDCTCPSPPSPPLSPSLPSPPLAPLPPTPPPPPSPPPSPPSPPPPKPSPQSGGGGSGGYGCEWTCNTCTNCQKLGSSCQLFGAPGTSCYMRNDCLFGPIVYRANQTLSPAEDWSCTPPGQTSGQCSCTASPSPSPHASPPASPSPDSPTHTPSYPPPYPPSTSPHPPSYPRPPSPSPKAQAQAKSSPSTSDYPPDPPHPPGWVDYGSSPAA